MCKILRNIMASAAEAYYGALFLNGQAAVPIRTTLIEMHHPQPPTPIQVDNSTAVGIANKRIKQKRSKDMDMRFHWIQDRIIQEHPAMDEVQQLLDYLASNPNAIIRYHASGMILFIHSDAISS